jgi:hypothetical protein
MAKKGIPGYLISVILLTVVLPIASILIETMHGADPWYATAKWFVFWAIGIRLLAAGFKQVFQPAFTAEMIFNIKDKASHAIIKELGFYNICVGLAGTLSLYLIGWLVPTAFIGGLYYGLAGIGHMSKKTDSLNEVAALVTDVLVFIVITVFLVHSFFLRNVF